jgi:hypothetical protein
MPSQLTVEDIVPLVAALTPQERLRLLRLMVGHSNDDGLLYKTIPTAPDEFSSEGDPLDWDSEGWENLA